MRNAYLLLLTVVLTSALAQAETVVPHTFEDDTPAESVTDCESTIGSPPDLKEIQAGSLKGYMEGYLKPDALPDSLKLLAAPPKKILQPSPLMLRSPKTIWPFKGVHVGT